MINRITKKLIPGTFVLLTSVCVLAESNDKLNVIGFNTKLNKNIIYYNSFNKPGSIKNPDLATFKIKYQNVPKKLIPDTGIDGSCAITGKKSGSYVMLSKQLSMMNNRTISFWFMFPKKIPKNTPSTSGAYFINNSGKSLETGKWNSIQVFIKGGPWMQLKDTNLLGQVWGFKGTNISTSIDKFFRKDYSEKVWHHIAVSSNGKDISVYLNGKKRRTMSSMRPFNEKDNLNKLCISGWGWPVRMLIDELIITDITLTEAQVSEYYSSVKALLERKELE